MIQVEIPNKNARVEFPDNTDPETIKRVIRENFYKPSLYEEAKGVVTDLVSKVSPYLKRDIPPQELPSRPISPEEASMNDFITSGDIVKIPLNLATGVASFLNPMPGGAGIYEGAKKFAEGIGSGIGTMAGGGGKWEDVPSLDKSLREADRGVAEGREAEQQALEMMGKVLPLGEPKSEIGKTVEGGIDKALKIVFKEPADYWASKVNPEKHPNLAATVAVFMEVSPLLLSPLKKGLKRAKIVRVVNDISDRAGKGVDITPEESQTIKNEIKNLAEYETPAIKEIPNEIKPIEPSAPSGVPPSKLIYRKEGNTVEQVGDEFRVSVVNEDATGLREL